MDGGYISHLVRFDTCLGTRAFLQEQCLSNLSAFIGYTDSNSAISSVEKVRRGEGSEAIGIGRVYSAWVF